tara:strand:+ start:297 stop:539 length:243 start_codon:yes stop_codon:yes gene_type:complete
MRYVIFSKPECPYCIKAIELLEKTEKTFKVVNFAPQQENILNEMKEAYEWSTVPMVFRIDEDGAIDFVGGYTDLSKYLGD